VEVDDMGLRELVLLLVDKIVDRGDMGECLHAKLAIESTTECIKDLIFLLRTVPYYFSR
jgi:hypothetical protein